jgi:uncharacterized protein
MNFCRIKLFSLVSALVILAAVSGTFAQSEQPWSQNVSPLPPPTGFVNDYANVIDTSTKAALEAKLKEFRDTTDPTVEIAVVVVKTTGNRDIFDYSLAVARGWGIGSKSDNNPSALLLVAIDDRKYFTQISKDLEGDLPDGIAGNLQRQHLVPEFRKGNYGKGISDTVDAFISTIRNKGNVPTAGTRPAARDGSDSDESSFPLFCCAVIVLFLIIVGSNLASRKKSSDDHDRWGGGGFGGGGGSGVSSALPWIIGGLLSGGGGSGGSSSSDWGSSGGSDWGGFGGGGDFGGGGAGGSW